MTISFDGKTIRSTGKMDRYESPMRRPHRGHGAAPRRVEGGWEKQLDTRCPRAYKLFARSWFMSRCQQKIDFRGFPFEPLDGTNFWAPATVRVTGTIVR